MWRTREIELKAQLTELRQAYIHLECQYETLITSKHLQSSRFCSPSCDDKTGNFDFSITTARKTNLDLTRNVVDNDDICTSIPSKSNTRKMTYTMGSYLSQTLNFAHSLSNLYSQLDDVATTSADNCSNLMSKSMYAPSETIQHLSDNQSSKDLVTFSFLSSSSQNSSSSSSLVKHNLESTSVNTDHGVKSLWKDIPPSVMTDSIGPLEDICLVPHDPLITSIYLNPDSKK